jgi:dephospho-CoA kinase
VNSRHETRDSKLLPRKPVIGLLGGIGSGKSSVARHFAKLGAAVISADDLSHRAINKPEVQHQLRAWWGDSVIAPDGTTDRRAVGKIVFADPVQLARLEGLLHPIIADERRRLREQYQSDPSVTAIVEDTPLLLEKNLEGDCDVLVYVDASLETRARRVRESRGWSEEELTRRQKSQTPLDIKRARADYVIDNNAGEAETFSHVRRVLSQILQNGNR